MTYFVILYFSQRAEHTGMRSAELLCRWQMVHNIWLAPANPESAKNHGTEEKRKGTEGQECQN